MKRLSFVFVSLFLSSLVLIPALLHAEPGLGAVQGTVTNASTGEPIQGAMVGAYSNWGMIKSTQTDSTGHYILTGLSAGSTNIAAHKFGFQESSKKVLILASDTVTADFALVPIPEPAKGSIQGTVTNASTGDPIQGAQVLAYGSMNSYNSTQTDSTGHYILTNLSTGSTYLIAKKLGFQQGSQQVNVLDKDTVTADFALVPIPEPAKGSIVGTVTDASTGNPIANAHVSAKKFGSYNWTSTTTDSNGNYILENLSTGSTRVLAFKSDYYEAFQNVNVIANSSVTADFALVPVVKPPKGAVEGTVSNASTGEPIAGALVYARPSSNSVRFASFEMNDFEGSQWAFTDSTGHYLLGNLSPADYLITASKCDYESASQNVTVIANNTVTVDLALAPKPPNKGTITGTVSDASTGNPIAGAFVYVSIDAQNWYSNLKYLYAQTDSTGHYTLNNVPAGDRHVKAVKKGYYVSETTITVIAGSTVTLDLALVPIPPKQRGSISGTVSDASTGLPISGAKVFVNDLHDISICYRTNSFYTTTDDNGNYSIDSVPIGVRYVIAIKEGYFGQKKQTTVYANQTSDVDFSLVPFGNNTATLVVTVIDGRSSTQGISNATVFIPVFDEVLPLTDWDDHWTTTNSSGSAQVGNIPLGTQLIVVSKDGYDSALVETNIYKGTNAITVVLNPNDTTNVNSWELYR